MRALRPSTGRTSTVTSAVAGEAPPSVAPGTITLALFAPRVEHVELHASWNGWTPVPLRRDADGWWRVDVTVADGEHLYRFRVRSMSYWAEGRLLDVADPYALSVTDDEWENARLTVRDGRRVYVEHDWRHDGVPLPPNERLVIYELHVADFAGTAERPGTFASVVDRLDYLRDLGVNAVELLPVREFPGRGWGYSARSLFAVENTYGPPEDLARLVDECHARGIRVILDAVYNHADMDSPLAKIDYEYWFHRTNPDGPEMDWGPKFNYEFYDQELGIHPARAYVADSLRFLVETFHVDGVRFDATAAVKNFDIMRAWTDLAYDRIGGRKPFVAIAEHVPEDPAVSGRDRGAPMDAAWCDHLGKCYRAVVSTSPQAEASPGDLAELVRSMDPAANGYGESGRMLTFVGNHDYHHVMHVVGDEGKIFGDAAFRRLRLGAALLLTAPGVPMLWMGEEFGFAADKAHDDARPLDWSLAGAGPGAGLLDAHRRLVGLRTSTAALQNDSFEVLLRDDERQLLAFKRWDEAGGVVVTLANLRDDDAGDVELSGPGLADGEYVDALTGDAATVAGNAVRVTLGPSEVRVWVKRS